MDKLSVIGLIIGVLAIFTGQLYEGVALGVLINIPALAIVLGGTLGAVFLQSPRGTLRKALQQLPWIFKPPKFSHRDHQAQILAWSRLVKQQGLLALEKSLKNKVDAFTQRAIETLVSGVSKEVFEQVMAVELESYFYIESRGARFFESLGGYAPTIGILGAVLGLVQVMQNLTDPTQLGVGIAVAFLATIYGVGFANLVFLPIANKLNDHVLARARQLSDELSARFRQAKVYQNDGWVEVSLKVASLFKPGGISVSLQGERELLSLGNLLKDKPGLLAVEGHADNLPVTSDSRYESNWSLSGARAASVAQVLAKAGVHADKIAVVGYADQFPVASNQTEAGRSKNRRVVIVIGKTKPGQRMLNPMASDPVREQREKTNYLNQTEEKTILKEKKTSSGGVRFTRETIRVKKEPTP